MFIVVRNDRPPLAFTLEVSLWSPSLHRPLSHIWYMHASLWLLSFCVSHFTNSRYMILIVYLFLCNAIHRSHSFFRSPRLFFPPFAFQTWLAGCGPLISSLACLNLLDTKGPLILARMLDYSDTHADPRDSLCMLELRRSSAS